MNITDCNADTELSYSVHLHVLRESGEWGSVHRLKAVLWNLVLNKDLLVGFSLLHPCKYSVSLLTDALHFGPS